jgi:hypothetical protein
MAVDLSNDFALRKWRSSTQRAAPRRKRLPHKRRFKDGVNNSNAAVRGCGAMTFSPHI